MRKRITRQFFSANALLICVMASQLAYCGGEKESPPKEKTSPLSDAGFRAFQEHTYPYLRKNCLPCHATKAPLVASSDPREAYQSAKKHTDFKAIPTSRLVEKTRDGHCGRACRADVTPLIEAIKKWGEKETTSGT